MAQQTDEIVIKFSVQADGTPKIEKLNQAISKTGQASKSIVPGLENARKGVTSFMSENAALIGILVGVGLAMGKAFKSYMAYADQVRDTSRHSAQVQRKPVRSFRSPMMWGLVTTI